LKIKLRDINRNDLPALERWFEETETKNRLGGMLPLARWFENVRILTNQKNYMALTGEVSTGMVTLETYEDRTASIALLVNPALRNQGFGKAIIRHALKLLDGCTEVHAHIEQDNTASIRCFGACGFIECSVDADDMLDMVHDFPNK
jgi:RimJ/RimL family protein N-acetyltransferase